MLLFALLMGYLMLGGIFNAIAMLNNISTAFNLDRVIQHGLTALVFFSAATALGVFYYLGNIASYQTKLVEGPYQFVDHCWYGLLDMLLPLPYRLFRHRKESTSKIG